MNSADAAERADDRHGLDALYEVRALRDELIALRASLAALSAELTTLRVAQAAATERQAAAIERMGRPTWSQISMFAGLMLAIIIQTGYAMYWAGGISSTQESVVQMIKEHRSKEGP